MKNKFERLEKAEKKKAIEAYKESSENHKTIYSRLKRIKIMSIIGILYAIFSFFIDFYMSTLNVWDYILDGLLLIACVLFYLKAHDLFIQQVNTYLINKKK